MLFFETSFYFDYNCAYHTSRFGCNPGLHISMHRLFYLWLIQVSSSDFNSWSHQVEGNLISHNLASYGVPQMPDLKLLKFFFLAAFKSLVEKQIASSLHELSSRCIFDLTDFRFSIYSMRVASIPRAYPYYRLSAPTFYRFQFRLDEAM